MQSPRDDEGSERQQMYSFLAAVLRLHDVASYESNGVRPTAIVRNLFGRHLYPFAPGFRKSNSNGLLSALNSLATLPAL